MKPGSDYIPLESRFPLRGLRSSTPSTQLDPAYSPRLTNMRIREGVVSKRSGYYELDATNTLVGDVLALEDFQELDGTLNLVAITTKRQYHYNNTDWIDVTATEGQHAITAVDITGPDWFEISGDHTTAFAVDSEFEVEGSTGNNAFYIVTVVAVTAGVTRITVANIVNATADGVIVGPFYGIITSNAGSNILTLNGDWTASNLFGSGTANAGKTFVVERATDVPNGTYTINTVTLNAGDTEVTVDEDVTGSTGDGEAHLHRESTAIDGDYVDLVVGTDKNTHKIYVTNGRDRPVFWDGTNTRFRFWHPEFTNFTTCRSIDVFTDYLVLGNITLAGNTPKTIAWSDLAEFETFNTGDSGTLLIPSVQGIILNLSLLGDRLIIYSENTIGSLTFIGGTAIFSYQTIIQNTRLVSGQSIVSIGSAHLFAAQENLYFFDGTRSIRAVGDTIRELYKRDLDFEFGARLFMFNDVARRLIFVVVPTSSTTSSLYVLDYDIFNLNEFKWTKVEYTNRPQSLGFFARRTAPSWIDPPDVPWNEEDGIWDDESERVNFPVRIIGSGSKVYLQDETTTDDDGTAVTASYETRDFVVPLEDQSVVGRWAEIEADLGGQEVEVSYSTNQGGLWTLVETKTLVSEFKQYNFPIDTVSRTLRVRFESTKFFSFRWIRVWVNPGSPR